MSDADLIIISAPSGVGKTTLIRRLLARVSHIDFSVSYTTRAPRKGEREGVDYHFVTSDAFDEMVRREELLEWAVVHGERYGTRESLVEDSLARGYDVVLDLDVQGAASVKEKRPDAVTIFVMPPDRESLEGRLRSRALDSPEQVATRLRDAAGEVARYVEYDYVVVNNILNEALSALERIVMGRRSLRPRMEPECRRILESFHRT